MNRINRILFPIVGVTLLTLSFGLSCEANPVGLSASCTTTGTGYCGPDNIDEFGFVGADAGAIAPGEPDLPATASAFAQADDTLTFLGHGHAFVEFEFFEFIYNDSGGSASASFDNAGLTYDPTSGTFDSPMLAITFGTPFSFDISASASEDLSGALAGHPRESEALLQLTDILVVNAGGHPLRNIHFTSGSGTLYPLDAANTLPSPEPSSLSLLGFGLIALLLMAARKKFEFQL